ncbi:MAG: GNAT family N-acetyltransferase [Planctomycetota bacterium]|nr:MAG: GNAT family N-acetyltransferase [Planctomycetota bacterium]
MGGALRRGRGRSPDLPLRGGGGLPGRPRGLRRHRPPGRRGGRSALRRRAAATLPRPDRPGPGDVGEGRLRRPELPAGGPGQGRAAPLLGLRRPYRDGRRHRRSHRPALPRRRRRRPRLRILAVRPRGHGGRRRHLARRAGVSPGRPFRLAPFDRAERGQELAELLGLAFNFPPEDAPEWWDRGGDDRLRLLLTPDGRLAGTLLWVPMGHFLGGRAVGCCGVAGVAVAHEFRGRGAATWMMREALREMRAAGFPLSSLYPSTIRLYRKAGYELAGHYYTTTLRLREIEGGSHERRVRPLRGDEMPLVRDLYRRVAVGRHGWLDRDRYLWSRVHRPRLGPAHGFAAEGPDGIEGYLFFVNQKGEGWKSRMVLTDLVAATPEAGRSLLGLLAGNGTMHEDAVLHLPPEDPILQHIPGRTVRSRLEERWMLRVLDPAAAVAARGWPAPLSGRVDLELLDDLFPENAGRWTLEVAAGRGELRRAAAGAAGPVLRLDVRSFAQLYAGYQSAAALAAIGRADGPEETVAAADWLFRGPAPTLPEMF